MKKARRASKSKAASSKSRPRPARKSKSLKRKILPTPRIKGLLSRVKTKTIPKRAKASAQVEPMSVLHQETPREIHELPFSYNKTELVLMVRDPYWAYTYWDFSADTWNWLVVFREKDSGIKPKLRVHNLDDKTFQEKDIDLEAKHWYLEVGLPETSFEIELGFVDSQGNFHSIVRSNRIRTPRNGPSQNIDSQWNLSDFEFSELYRLSGGGKTGSGSDAFSSFRRR